MPAASSKPIWPASARMHFVRRVPSAWQSRLTRRERGQAIQNKLQEKQIVIPAKAGIALQQANVVHSVISSC
jgi:hypothetical protein